MLEITVEAASRIVRERLDQGYLDRPHLSVDVALHDRHGIEAKEGEVVEVAGAAVVSAAVAVSATDTVSVVVATIGIGKGYGIGNGGLRR